MFLNLQNQQESLIQIDQEVLVANKHGNNLEVTLLFDLKSIKTETPLFDYDKIKDI